MDRKSFAVVTVAVAFALASRAVAAQGTDTSVPTVVIRDEPTCATCSVRLEHVVSLGSPEDSSSVVPWSTVARNSRGEYYVAPMAHPGEIYVYGPDGKYRAKIGRAGEGPGEYSGRTMVAVDAGDSIHVVDNVNRRWTVLGSDHEFARTAPLPGYVRRFFVAGNGRLITHADVGTTRCFGLPLQLLAPDGVVVRCFGGDGGVIRSDRPHSRMRHVTDGGAGLVWSARVNRYEIELLDSLGETKQRVIRDTGWFEPWDRDVSGAFVTEPPRPRIAGVASTEAGHLVVFVSVPDSKWRAPLPGTSNDVTPASLERNFDAVVEVLDPAEGKLIASTRFRTRLRPVSDGSLALYSFSEHESGDNQLDLWRIMLHGSDP